MKKTMYAMSIMLFLVILQQCRNSEFTSTEDASQEPRPVLRKENDSTRGKELYPDPPVRDGHDWKNGH